MKVFVPQIVSTYFRKLSPKLKSVLTFTDIFYFICTNFT